ncbi:MAG: hypothetical protein ACOYJF_10940 [Prevotella sp.]|jgi:hypothetical protein
MTSQIFKHLALMFVSFFSMVLSLQAQTPQTAQDPQTPQTTQTQVSIEEQLARLKRWEAMQPDSLAPKYQQALVILNYAVMNPQDSKSKDLLPEANNIINKMEALQPKKATDLSDIAALRGFYFTCLVVENPAQNGPRYYRDALDNFDKALNLNPDNELAKMLQKKFHEGMNNY